MRWSDGIWLSGHESEQTLEVSEGQSSLACCDLWGCKELDTIWWLNNTTKQMSDSCIWLANLNHVQILAASGMKVTQSCPTLCDPMDYIVHGILQATIQKWVAFSFSRGSSQPRNWTQVSCIAGGFFISWATREAVNQCCHFLYSRKLFLSFPQYYTESHLTRDNFLFSSSFKAENRPVQKCNLISDLTVL